MQTARLMHPKNFAHLAVMALILLVGCKDTPMDLPGTHGGKPPPAPIIQPIKDLAYFQPGSYWVYEDSATGRLDSNWVLRSSIRWIEQPQELPDNEKLNMDFGSSLGHVWYFNAIGADSPYYNAIERNAWQANNYVLWWPFEPGRDISRHYSLIDSVTQTRIIDSVTLPIGTIGPVYEVKLGPQGQTRYLYGTLWFCPGYGIVRQEYHEELNWPIGLNNPGAHKIKGDWKLIRAHIIQ